MSLLPPAIFSDSVVEMAESDSHICRQGMAAGFGNRNLPESFMVKYYFDRMLGVRSRALKRKTQKQE